MSKIISYFTNRPVVANILMFGTIILAFLLWPKMGKEEMPEFSMEWVRINVSYPGASAKDVELAITKPIEEKVKGLSGLEDVSSTSSYGQSSIRISFESNTKSLPEKIQEVKDAVNSANLPREAEPPVFRQFKSSEKAIIDIGVHLDGEEILDIKSRTKLQKYALAFKNKILSLPEISGVDESGYLRPEIQIKIDPKKLELFEITMEQVKAQINEKNIRRPIGSMEDKQESEVTIVSELGDIESLEDVIISSGFGGQKIRLSQVASVEHNFKKSNSILKIQGHEAVMLNIKKGSNTDILSAQKAVVKFIDAFEKNSPNSQIKFTLIDDESYDVRNRLSLIGSNGLIGFAFIVFVLFLFLDFKSGIWVAMGIPFSLAVTLIVALIFGYSINNMTLASIIVVLGIVVDDAIIVAENIVRQKSNDQSPAVTSTLEVLGPIFASVLTTCAAFVPLYFFSGRFGMFVKYIPIIVCIMLFASLIESFLILPSHMNQENKFDKIFKKMKFNIKITELRNKTVSSLERRYASFLSLILRYKSLVLVGFVALLIGSGYIFKTQLRYVMFPREEASEFRLKAVAEEDLTRFETAKKIREIEDIFIQNKFVTSVNSSVGQSRRGGQVKENQASIRVEIVPPSDRDISLKELISGWQPLLDKIKGFKEIKFQKNRFGSDSGSPIVIEVQENSDEDRSEIVERLKTAMESMPELTNIEVEKPISKKEYQLKIKKDEASRLGINYEQLSSTLRAYIEGDILYTLNSGEEEVDVRFTSEKKSKDNITDLLKLTVANKNNYLVPIKDLVEVNERFKQANIERVNYKRTTAIYADLNSETKKSPLEIAEILESEVFPLIYSGFPSTSLYFGGEVANSRESQSNFSLSVILALAIIYVLLVFLFDSLWTPFLIGAIIPFGVIGTGLSFWLHGMSQFGFFAIVGTLGMIGVVINDSIVLIDKLGTSIKIESITKATLVNKVADVCSTRLRAVVVTTLTTVAGLFPTAYGLGGYDSMLAEMMLAMGWGLLFGMVITLMLVPCLYCASLQTKIYFRGVVK